MRNTQKYRAEVSEWSLSNDVFHCRLIFSLKSSKYSDLFYTCFWHSGTRTQKCTWRLHICHSSLVAQMGKNLPAVLETWVQSLGWDDPLEKLMTTHSNILAWRISMDTGAWWAMYGPWGHRDSDTTEHSTACHSDFQLIPIFLPLMLHSSYLCYVWVSKARCKE